MRKLRYLIRQFFGFNRSQTNAFLLLLPAMALVLFSKPLTRWVGGHESVSAADRIKFDSLIAIWEADTLSLPFQTSEIFSPEKFHFNPNHSTREEFLALGFDERLAARIISYREKGGKFLVKKDLSKMYGLDSAFFKALYTFIDLPEQLSGEYQKERRASTGKSERLIIKIDLNTADSISLMKVYGIGSKLSARIISYRERLGGFIEIHQLKEVYGLDSAVISEMDRRFFIENDFTPKTINLNVADVKQLSVHPYITRRQAEAIVAYRFQHGSFQTIQDLAKIRLMDESTLNKILPYLKLND